jgi:purine nucleosidase
LIALTVDCDAGIDDAIALSYLAGERRSGRVDIRRVVSVAGNVDARTAARNAAFVLDRLGLDDVPVVEGSGRPLTPLGYELGGPAFHGTDGIGGQYERGHPQRAGRVEIGDLARTYRGGDADAVLAIGPLTNVARVLPADGADTGPMPRLIVMGGAFGDPAGNVTPCAEFNFHLDATAADAVMTSGLPVTVVPLDVTMRVLITADDLGRLSDSPAGRMARGLLDASIRIHQEQMGLGGCIMHDALAAAIAVDPTLVTPTGHLVRVDTEGDRRGACTLGGPGTVAVALEVDVERALDQILGSLALL